MSAPHMTLDEFLEALAETRNGWSGGLTLRRSRRGWTDFPVTAVANDRRRNRQRRFSIHNFRQAAAALGLDSRMTTSIVNAADVATGRNKLARRLRKAVGL